jgi:ABC-type transport system involved in resistance to organic solvents, permease component
MWLGPRSFHLVAVAAVFVSMALTTQCVIELKRYQAEDLSGAAITIGLLRELGAITISVAWCAMVSALIAEEAKASRGRWASQRDFARYFVLPRYLSALMMSLPLSAYGLLIGFITAALFGQAIGGSPITDFTESARQAIHDKDLVVYFTKLFLVNPTIGVFAGCAAGLAARHSDTPVAPQAMTATFISCLAMNLAVTAMAYLSGEAIY